MGREDGIDAGDQPAVGDGDRTETEALLWDRVVRFRSAQCDDLPYSVVRSLLQEFQIALNSNEETVQDFLKRHVAISTDPSADSAERRRSFTRVQSLLARIVREKKKLANNNAAGARKSVVGAVGDAVRDGSTPTAVQLSVDPNGDSERTGVFRAPMERPPQAVVELLRSSDQDDEDVGGEVLSLTAGERGVMIAGGRVARNEANSGASETSSLTAPHVQEVDHNINARSTSSVFVPASSINTPSIAAIGHDLVPTPRPNDVIVGRRNEYMDHPGNAQCRKWIYDLAMQEYSRSPTREEKFFVWRTAIAKVYAAGGRFLERANSTSSFWRKVDENSILDILEQESQQLQPQERQQLRTETTHGLASQTSSRYSAAMVLANNHESILPYHSLSRQERSSSWYSALYRYRTPTRRVVLF